READHAAPAAPLDRPLDGWRGRTPLPATISRSLRRRGPVGADARDPSRESAAGADAVHDRPRPGYWSRHFLYPGSRPMEPRPHPDPRAQQGLERPRTLPPAIRLVLGEYRTTRRRADLGLARQRTSPRR